MFGAICAPAARAQQPAAPTIPAAPPDQAVPATPPVDQTAPAPVIVPSPTPVAVAEPSQSEPSNHFYIGPEVGVFFPTSSKTSNRFGSAWYSLGLALGPVSSVSTSGSLSFDFGLQYQSRSGNHVLLVPLGAEYRIGLSQRTASAQPYAGVAADLYIVNVKSGEDNVNATEATGGASALIGLNVGKNTNLEARYQFVSSVKGFDFSGLSLSAGYRF